MLTITTSLAFLIAIFFSLLNKMTITKQKNVVFVKESECVHTLFEVCITIDKC